MHHNRLSSIAANLSDEPESKKDGDESTTKYLFFDVSGMQLLKYAGWRFGSDDSARGTAPSMYVHNIADLQFCRRLKVALVAKFEDSAYFPCLCHVLPVSFREGPALAEEVPIRTA